jgi:diketogulonate reductase-like aldo/keto reductase
MTARLRTADQHLRQLGDGNHIPVLGLGVWQIPNGRSCVNAVRWALEIGYRHIDTAQEYGNEESVGRAVKESGLPREEVFITTKFLPGASDPVAEGEGSLSRLGLDYVDLYLVHWPQGGPTRAWRGMERARERGYARSIGVSNYDVRDLERVIAAATVPPVVNQVQFSPFEYRRKLLEASERHDVALEAYSPLGTGRHLANRTVKQLAARIGRTPAQVLLRWGLQHNLMVIPKSAHRDRIEENSRIFDFTLAADDMAVLDALDETGGTDRALEGNWW